MHVPRRSGATVSAVRVDERIVRALEAVIDGDRDLAMGILEDLLRELDGTTCDYCKGTLSVAERHDARAARRKGYGGLCGPCLHRLSTRAA